MTAPPSLHFPMATDLPGARPQPPQPERPPVEPYYADIEVVAYRTPEDEQRVADLHPTITSSAGAIDGETLMDGKYATAVTIPGWKAIGAAGSSSSFAAVPHTGRDHRLCTRSSVQRRWIAEG